MKKYFFVFLLSILILISGCSNSLGGSSNKEDLTGNGLEVSFDVDSLEDLTFGKFDLLLSLKNSGKDPITITKNNLILSTTEKDSQGNNILTSDSIDNFYNEILKHGDVTLYQNQEIGPFRIPLYVEQNYFKDLTNEDFTISLEVKYAYSTSFSNTIFVSQNSRNIIKIEDRLSQAAPLHINSLRVTKQSLEDFALEFNLGPSSSLGNDFRIGGSVFGVTFGTDTLSCNFLDESTREQRDSFVLNPQNRGQLLACDLDLRDDEYSTQVSGFINYDVTMSKSRTISLPKLN